MRPFKTFKPLPSGSSGGGTDDPKTTGSAGGAGGERPKHGTAAELARLLVDLSREVQWFFGLSVQMRLKETHPKEQERLRKQHESWVKLISLLALARETVLAVLFADATDEGAWRVVDLRCDEQRRRLAAAWQRAEELQKSTYPEYAGDSPAWRRHYANAAGDGGPGVVREFLGLPLAHWYGRLPGFFEAAWKEALNCRRIIRGVRNFEHLGLLSDEPRADGVEGVLEEGMDQYAWDIPYEEWDGLPDEMRLRHIGLPIVNGTRHLKEPPKRNDMETADKKKPYNKVPHKEKPDDETPAEKAKRFLAEADPQRYLAEADKKRLAKADEKRRYEYHAAQKEYETNLKLSKGDLENLSNMLLETLRTFPISKVAIAAVSYDAPRADGWQNLLNDLEGFTIRDPFQLDSPIDAPILSPVDLDEFSRWRRQQQMHIARRAGHPLPTTTRSPSEMRGGKDADQQTTTQDEAFPAPAGADELRRAIALAADIAEKVDDISAKLRAARSKTRTTEEGKSTTEEGKSTTEEGKSTTEEGKSTTEERRSSQTEERRSSQGAAAAGLRQRWSEIQSWVVLVRKQTASMQAVLEEQKHEAGGRGKGKGKAGGGMPAEAARRARGWCQEAWQRLSDIEDECDAFLAAQGGGGGGGPPDQFLESLVARWREFPVAKPDPELHGGEMPAWYKKLGDIEPRGVDYLWDQQPQTQTKQISEGGDTPTPTTVAPAPPPLGPTHRLTGEQYREAVSAIEAVYGQAEEVLGHVAQLTLSAHYGREWTQTWRELNLAAATVEGVHDVVRSQWGRGFAAAEPEPNKDAEAEGTERGPLLGPGEWATFRRFLAQARKAFGACSQALGDWERSKTSPAESTTRRIADLAGEVPVCDRLHEALQAVLLAAPGESNKAAVDPSWFGPPPAPPMTPRSPTASAAAAAAAAAAIQQQTPGRRAVGWSLEWQDLQQQLRQQRRWPRRAGRLWARALDLVGLVTVTCLCLLQLHPRQQPPWLLAVPVLCFAALGAAGPGGTGIERTTFGGFPLLGRFHFGFGNLGRSELATVAVLLALLLLPHAAAAAVAAPAALLWCLAAWLFGDPWEKVRVG
ncbi:hypothetical protein GGR56DRAFT_253950 [Xylariaceae sp. FL0804]|nr:hypothetical protein GGR56DRAFT_253950 [Xylariaceae sp. FL0804]